MGKHSSALSLSFLYLSDFPKYVVLKSEFSSNLVVFAIYEWILSYMLRYSSFNIPGVGPEPTSTIYFSSLASEWFLQIFTELMPKLWKFFWCLSCCMQFSMLLKIDNGSICVNNGSISSALFSIISLYGFVSPLVSSNLFNCHFCCNSCCNVSVLIISPDCLFVNKIGLFSCQILPYARFVVVY